jgi:hypothetical protein
MNISRTPVLSNHVSRPSFDARKAMIMDMVVEAPQNHQQAKANVNATFDHVISAVYKYPAPFSRPEFGMDFVASYQAYTMLLPLNITRELELELELELGRATGAALCHRMCIYLP